MQRDVAKTLFAASPLYGTVKAESLTLLGEQILEETCASLPNGHPTKPLIGIELTLSQASRGAPIDKESLKRDFTALRDLDENLNPHRVATVASWFVAWGEKLQDEPLKEVGEEVFTRIIRQHPEWAFMTENEKQKVNKQQLRKWLFRVLTPLTTSLLHREALALKLKTRRGV